jgi:hypothetical protein
VTFSSSALWEFEHFYPVRTKHDANWYVNILRKSEIQRRSELVKLESHPFGETIMKLTPEQRDIVRGLFEAEAHIRNPAEQ